MNALTTFKGAAKALDDIDLPRIGSLIRVGEDEIHAVIDVETAGGPWDARGRPKMLFEPHRFWKELGPGPKRDRAVREGLAYPTWGEKPYPKDSYPRLLKAMEIDREAALRSASWGLGQVLGSNHEMVGYDSAEEMVVALLDDAEVHLEQMVRFIQSAKLDEPLRRHDWRAFARGYNGPQYAKHGYHTKLAAAFARWKKIRDTPWSPALDVEILPPTGSAEILAAGPVSIPAPRPEIDLQATHVPAAASEEGTAVVEKAVTPVDPVTDKPLTPLEQMNKPVQGAKAGLGAGTLGGALLLLVSSAGWLPDAWTSGEPAIALGLVVASISAVAGNFVGSYLARDKRFPVQP